MSAKEGIIFSQTQKKGIIVLLAAILMATAAMYGLKSLGLRDSVPFSFPTKAVVNRAEQAGPMGEVESLLIDVNLADSSQWVQLRGIGPVLARRILNYREAIGGFSSIDQVANVYGLRPEVFKEIKGNIYTHSATIPASAYNSVSAPRRTEFTGTENIDINVAEAKDFESLPGIGKVLSQRIVNYRKALGGFESTSQIGKVFNLDPEVFAQIEPYLYVDEATIPRELQAKSRQVQHTSTTPYPSGNNANIPSRSKDARDESPVNGTAPTASDGTNARYLSASRGAEARPQVIDLNLADSAILVSLPGIGATLAPRIIRYRTLLGYFISVDQLKNVYGLSESNFQLMMPYLRIGDTSKYPRKDLNAAPPHRLAAFPHISRQLSEAIVAHRKQLGWFESWDQVAMVNGMTPEALEELKAYFEM